MFASWRLLDRGYVTRWPKIELVDIRKRLPLESGSVDFIYCSHVLEHFEKDEALKILKEINRVLKKRGKIRVVLPDLKKMMANYSTADEFNNEYFGFDKQLYVGFLGRIKRHFIRGHQWMYDLRSAKLLLREAGFNEVKVCSFRKGEVPNLEKLDLELHRKLSLYLEAGNKRSK